MAAWIFGTVVVGAPTVKNTERSTWPTHGEARPSDEPLTLAGQTLGVATGSFRNASRFGPVRVPEVTPAGDDPPPHAVASAARVAAAAATRVRCLNVGETG